VPKDYKNSWQEKPSAVEIRQSALKLAQTIVALGDGVHRQHKCKLLRDVVWIVTEANGKYDTRYVSKAVYAGQGPIEHEHVFPIEGLVEEMLRNPDNIDQVLDTAIACLVTKEEHNLLSKSGKGWTRYRQSGIRVYDRLEGKWLDW
jgi:hypothetical protein